MCSTPHQACTWKRIKCSAQGFSNTSRAGLPLAPPAVKTPLHLASCSKDSQHRPATGDEQLPYQAASAEVSTTIRQPPCATDSYCSTRAAPTRVRDDLAQEAEVRLVRDEAQHDEVGIQAVQAVPLVGLPGAHGVALRPAYVLHDLMLALARHVVACVEALLMWCMYMRRV